jgi:hypothetical protein
MRDALDIDIDKDDVGKLMKVTSELANILAASILTMKGRKQI